MDTTSYASPVVNNPLFPAGRSHPDAGQDPNQILCPETEHERLQSSALTEPQFSIDENSRQRLSLNLEVFDVEPRRYASRNELSTSPESSYPSDPLCAPVRKTTINSNGGDSVRTDADARPNHSASEARAQEVHIGPQERITLNVGGAHHEALFSTLAQLPNSRLGAVLYSTEYILLVNSMVDFV